MTTNFNYFLHRWRNKALDRDVTWRGYEILAAVQPRHVQAAIKALGLGYAGELAIPHFCELYEVPSWDLAREILGAWWVWSRLTQGRRLRVPKRTGELSP